MKVELDNAQSGGPHIDIVDDGGIIRCQISYCSDGTILVNGEKAEERDGILLWPIRKRKTE